MQGTDGEAVLDTMLIWGNMYEQCRVRHDALVGVCSASDK